MAQILRETTSSDVGCYRADARAIGSSPAWQGVLNGCGASGND
jgi:hypothetical protein